MTLQDLGSLGELLAAIATIGTLRYLRLGNPGVREWWSENPFSFSPEFRAHVEGHMGNLVGST